MSEEVKKDEDWMQKKWRPAMGWMYMLVCTCDMVIFPVLWSILQASLKQPVTQWNPLTLQGAGLFHLAMGAVLGIAAFGRTQEKIAGTATNATPALPTSMPTSSGLPSTIPSAIPVMPMPSMSPPSAMSPVPGDPPFRNTRND